MMMKSETSVLIVAKPTRMRDGLRTLLRANPLIAAVLQADDVPSALRIVNDYPLAFILLDSTLVNDQVETIIRPAKLKSAETRCIVLADNVKQQQLAWAHGADDVLLAGFSAAKLFTSIEKLFSHQEVSPNGSSSSR
jgi:DNA-binding NarL/FixJ family response regulator